MKYLDFIEECGRPLSDINPGSDEWAISLNDVPSALKLLKDEQWIILGGQLLLTDSTDRLVYAVHAWSFDYHYLSWHYEPNRSDNREVSAPRSFEAAVAGIAEITRVAKIKGCDCYIVFVVR
ncbi:MAG: hypothetical protein LBG44_06310 [Gemmatimonadota bacterium]|jgi:hypothetical protein|nr:hypothetical protein [Gemmatimonadota bacterium]